MTITEDYKRELYAYLHGILKNQKCKLLRMNGTPNHIHMLVDVNPALSLSQLMQQVKRSSSFWLKQQKDKFPDFDGWEHEYAAFSVAWENREAVINYIRGQEAHHHTVTFDDEYKELLSDYDKLIYGEGSTSPK